MDRPTRELHAMLIRLLKGVLSAWEKWLNSQPNQDTKQE